MNLKTTAEERASGRDLFAEDWDPADVQDAPTRLLRALDDIDTLLAEVERLRAGIADIRRIEAAFAPVSMVEARRSINEISTFLGPLETK